MKICVRCNTWPKAKGHKYCRACWSWYVSKTRDDKKAYIDLHKATLGCTDCGETDAIVLEMDHLNPAEKDPRLRGKAGPARWKWGLTLLSWASIDDELAKCEVVCANCHRRREHYRRTRTDPASRAG